MAHTPARLLRLLSLLQTPREWPGSELARRLEVSPRTVRRDIDRLREIGYPVEATQGAAGGYRLVAGRAMPPLLLEDEEAVAVALGLRAVVNDAIEGMDEASAGALAKLEQVLPARLRHRVASLHAATVPLTPGDGPTIDPGLLTQIAAAISGRERLRLAYRSGQGDESERVVEPHRLVTAGRRWYLLAHDRGRGDWRTFRLDRILAARPAGARFTPRPPPQGGAAAYVASRLYSLAPTYGAVARVDAPAEEVARRLGPAVEVEPHDAGRCRIRMHTDTLEWLAFRLALLGSDFEVEEPPELIEHLRRLGARISHAAGAAARPTRPPAM
ncbi:MAG TPA: YafY family protein [Candidatus Dormibacteraeota bacterium]|nr:YafY family protein [Candidatus Dormibacteraeota bacterium]